MKRLMTGLFAGAAVLCAGTIGTYAGEKTTVSDEAAVFIVSPADGATVSSPVTVKLGHKGVEIRASGGDTVHNAGHHVLLIDTPMPALDEDIPFDNKHLHLADGATEVELHLAPGTHTLQLLLVDHGHAVHATPVKSEMPITITVK